MVLEHGPDFWPREGCYFRRHIMSNDELSDAGGPQCSNLQASCSARIRSSDLVSLQSRHCSFNSTSQASISGVGNLCFAPLLNKLPSYQPTHSIGARGDSPLRRSTA